MKISFLTVSRFQNQKVFTFIMEFNVEITQPLLYVCFSSSASPLIAWPNLFWKSWPGYTHTHTHTHIHTCCLCLLTVLCKCVCVNIGHVRHANFNVCMFVQGICSHFDGFCQFPCLPHTIKPCASIIKHCN